MLKRLALLIFVAILLGNGATAFASPPNGAYCLNPSNQWIPVAVLVSSTVYPGTPPPASLYGSSNGGTTWYPLACDANGNLIISGPTQTCIAASVANYAPAVCVFTLSAANLLQFDGTSATVINVIGAPGSGKMLSINPWTVLGNYIAGSHVYPASFPNFDFMCGSTGCTWGFGLALDVSKTANQIGAGATGFNFFNGPTSSIANVPFSVYTSVPVTPGIATSTLDVAGTLWAVGDTFNDSTCGDSALGTVVSITGLGPTGPIATYTFTGGSNFSGSACVIGTGDALVAVSPSTGTGASINVTGLTTPGNGTVVLTIPYTVVPVS